MLIVVMKIKDISEKVSLLNGMKNLKQQHTERHIASVLEPLLVGF